METLDKAIEQLTKLRIQCMKEKRDDLERALYNIEQLIFKAYDQFPVENSLRTDDFRGMRMASGLTLRAVEKITGISNAYLSQLETGKIKKPSFDTVKKLNDLYIKNK